MTTQEAYDAIKAAIENGPHEGQQEDAATCVRCLGISALEESRKVICLATAAPDLYAALEALLKGGQHEGPCDNGDYHDEACTLHLAAAEARKQQARAALLKANPQEVKTDDDG